MAGRKLEMVMMTLYPVTRRKLRFVVDMVDRQRKKKDRLKGPAFADDEEVADRGLQRVPAGTVRDEEDEALAGCLL